MRFLPACILPAVCGALVCGMAAQAAPAPSAAPSVPLLRISAPTPVAMHGPKGTTIRYWKVQVTNPNDVAATAYTITYLTHMPFGFDSRGARWFDSIPGIHFQPPLAPQATSSLSIPWHGGRLPSVQNGCVIYANGDVAGNYSLVGHFMSARAVFLAELPATIARLRRIASGADANRAAILAHFRAQAEVERRLLHTFDPKGEHPRAPARIAQSIVATFTDSHRDVQDIASVLAQTLTTWQRELVASKPTLPVIAFENPR